MVKRIIIWVLVIAFAYFFFSTIAKTCKNPIGDAAGSAASTIGNATQAGTNKVKEIASFEDDNADEGYDIDDENDSAKRAKNALDEEDSKYDDDAEDTNNATSDRNSKYDSDDEDELDEDAINAKLKAVSSGRLSKAATSYTKKDNTTAAAEASSTKNSRSSASSSSASTNSFSSDKKFLVVAGSYKEKKNAQEMVKKLKNIGYDDAELFTFDFAEYYSVTAGRYASKSDAAAIAKKLKAKGIDCYAHQMRSKYFD